MAEAIQVQSIKVNLLLSEHEARYLLALTQNFLGGFMPTEAEEPKDELKHRNAIFTALNKTGLTL